MYQVRRKISLLLLVVLLLPAGLPAAVLEDFYRVEIPAAQEQSRDQALREALALMLMRQVGSEAAGSQALESAMRDPKAYMRRIAGTDAGGVKVEFEPALLRSLLAQAGLPMLGPNRPTVMLWAVENGPLGAELLSQSGVWSTVLGDAAQRRAVALSLPMADLEDRALVEVKSIEQANAKTLEQASKRYGANAVLALTIGEQSGKPVLDWTWWLNDQSDSGRITADSEAAAADELMLAVSDRVVSQYAVAPSSTAQVSSWEVVVDGIDSVEEFAGLQRTMQQLGSNQMLHVLSVNGDQVRLAVDFPGTEPQLARLLALDQRLRRIPAPEPERLPELPSEASPGALAGQAASDLDEGMADTTETASSEADTADPVAEIAVPLAPEAASLKPEPPRNIMFFRWR